MTSESKMPKHTKICYRRSNWSILTLMLQNNRIHYTRAYCHP